MEKQGKLELTWVGKYEEERLEPRILIEDPEKSNGEDSENMLIHGDNLLALRVQEYDFSGKIKCVYIDPPYNSRQYLPNYHLLETIARYDKPNIKGKTGIRTYDNEKSNYCIKAKVYSELEELICNAKFKHIIMSYNQEGILKKEEIEHILKKYGEKKTYKLYKIPYKQYQNKLTKKIEKHYEYIFYIKKEKIFREENHSNEKVSKKYCFSSCGITFDCNYAVCCICK